MRTIRGVCVDLLSGPVFPVGEREQLPAFALEEGASRAPDGLGATEHYLFAALPANKDHASVRTDHVRPSGSCSARGIRLTHPRGGHKVNLPGLRATFASPHPT